MTYYITADDVTVGEADGFADFVVRLSAASASPVTVKYATSVGTAGAADFTAMTGTLIFAAGETVKTVHVPIANDTGAEATEAFFLNLSNATNATLATRVATAVIVDNDAAPGTPVVSVSDIMVDEFDQVATFVITLDRPATGTVSMAYRTQDGSAAAGDDYAAQAGTITFVAGETAKTITIPIVRDAVQESAEAFSLVLSNFSGVTAADRAGTAVIGASVPFTASSASIVVEDVVVSEGDGFAEFVVRLNAASSKNVFVDYATGNGSADSTQDYLALTGKLLFMPGETVKIVRVPLREDSLAEAAQDFTLTLSGATNAVITRNVGTATILDNDGAATPATATGSARDDLLRGHDGADTLNGLAGMDVLLGGAGNDVLNGGDDKDVLDGGQGDDTLNGGAGLDTASYHGAKSGVKVDLTSTAAQNTGGAGIDTLSSIENLWGSIYADTFIASNGPNVLSGGDGADTVDYRAATAGVTVSLAVSGMQDTGGSGKDTLVSIENLIGSAFDDTLGGDAGNNVLNGAGGNDTVSYAAATGGVAVDLRIITAQNTGGAGSDTLTQFENVTGSAFADHLIGDAGKNILDGGDGDDVLEGLGAQDTINGGLGNDTVSYALSGSAVSIRLQDGWNNIDKLISIENVIGSAFNDTLYGNGLNNVLTGGNGTDRLYGDAGVDTLYGGAGDDELRAGADDDMLDGGTGNDHLFGGLGNDVINGGSGSDTVDYGDITGPVIVNLNITTAQDTSGGGRVSAGIDTLISIENLTGSPYADYLIGDAGDNVLKGGYGFDILEGGDGNDTLDGGALTDTATYASAGSGVTVSLAKTGAQDTKGAGTDTLISIERLIGSAYADTLTGNSGENRLEGGDGDDILADGAGNDTLVGGNGIDTASYAPATAGVTVSLALVSTQATGGAGYDVLTSIENLIGSAFGDTLSGNAGVNVINGGGGGDTIEGGAGDDTLDGGAGFDTVSYASASTGVTVDLRLTGAQDTVGAGFDTLLNFEKITGSAFNDQLAGNSAANTLRGDLGDDFLNGGGGADTLQGGLGDDTYFVDNAGDIVAEYADGGTDTVRASISYALTSEVEKLVLLGPGAIDGTGNALANTLTGNSGANLLNGGAGSDTLSGLGGADTFLFADALGAGNVDTLVDFTVGVDVIHLDHTVFTGLPTGALAPQAFATGPAATQGDDRIIYDSATGALVFDADGAGGNAGVQFAQLATGLALSAADFGVV